MSFYTDIKFSCNLIQNEKVNITYSGDLFKKNSDSVTIVYGFGDEWNSTTEQLMEKTENGFTTEINLLKFNKFNFCFRNSNYEWDNNNYQNYTAPISEEQIEETKEVEVEKVEEEIDEKFIINENVIVEILDNLFEKDISKIENKVIEEITNTEPIQESTVIENQQIETTENNEFSKTNINTENIVENISEIDTISNDSNENIEFFVDVEKNEPVTIEDSIVNVTEETTLNNELENIFNDIYKVENIAVNDTNETNTPNIEDSEPNVVNEFENIENNETETNIKTENTENLNTEDVKVSNNVSKDVDKQDLLTDILSEKQSNTEKISEFDMDNLIDEILSPIVHSSTFEQENLSSIENFKQEQTKTDFSTTPIDATDEQIDDTINNLINDLYKGANNIIKNANFTPENNVNIDEIETTSNTEFKIETEEPLIDVLNTEKETEDISTQTALIEVDNQDDFLVSPRSLGKFYMFKKKVKLAFYKLFVGIPKMLSKTLDEGKTNK